jgi:hypothetical protein
MIDVFDRVPGKPTRIKLIRADGTEEIVTWERADEPVEPGTPINRALFESIKGDVEDRVKKTGDTMTGNLDIDNQLPRVALKGGVANRTAALTQYPTGNVGLANNNDSNGNYTEFTVLPETAALQNQVRFRNVVGTRGTNYYIYGEHNKPLGSYIGTGTATLRSVGTGAHSSLLMVWSENDVLAFVSPNGAFVLSGATPGWLDSTKAYYINGILRIAYDGTDLNGVGVTYNYKAV